MRFSRATWITALVVLGSLGIAFALMNGRPRPEGAPDGVVAAPVAAISVQLEALPGAVRAGGFLRAQDDVTLSAERAGRVGSFPVAEGQPVRAGEPVVHLDDTAAAARLREARAAEREASLRPETPAATLAAAQAQLRLAEHEVRLHHPVAPIDGVVEVHHVDAGEYVAPGTPLVDVLDAATLLLDADVDAAAVGALAPGAPVTLAVAALGARGDAGADGSGGIAARIRRVASRADPRTRRFRVEVEVAAGDTGLRPGMHAVARFELPAGEPALYVPKAATRRTRGEHGVFVVVDGHARWEPLQVEEVAARPDLWRVVGGALAPGAEIVVRGFSGLRPGIPVTVER